MGCGSKIKGFFSNIIAVFVNIVNHIIAATMRVIQTINTHIIQPVLRPIEKEVSRTYGRVEAEVSRSASKVSAEVSRAGTRIESEVSRVGDRIETEVSRSYDKIEEQVNRFYHGTFLKWIDAFVDHVWDDFMGGVFDTMDKVYEEVFGIKGIFRGFSNFVRLAGNMWKGIFRGNIMAIVAMLIVMIIGYFTLTAGQAFFGAVGDGGTIVSSGLGATTASGAPLLTTGALVKLTGFILFKGALFVSSLYGLFDFVDALVGPQGMYASFEDMAYASYSIGEFGLEGMMIMFVGMFETGYRMQERRQQEVTNMYVTGRNGLWMAGGALYDSPRGGGYFFKPEGRLYTSVFLGNGNQNTSTFEGYREGYVAEVSTNVLNVRAGSEGYSISPFSYMT